MLTGIGAAALFLGLPGAAGAQDHHGRAHHGHSARAVHDRGHSSVNVFVAPSGRYYQGYGYSDPYYPGYGSYGRYGYADPYHGGYGYGSGYYRDYYGRSPRQHVRRHRRHGRGHHGH
jgi:hypothetical protein